MKKILCLILSLVMLTSLCACSSDTGGESETETSPPFTIGTSRGESYHSDFLGLTVTIPDEWRFYSEEEILALNNITQSFFDFKAKEALENADKVHDMVALMESDGSSITVVFRKLPVAELASFDYDTYINSQLEALKITYEGFGLSNVEIKSDKIKVDGRTLNGITLTGVIYGTEFCMKMLVIQQGSYLANIDIGAYGSDEVDEILDWFDFD